MHFFLNKSGWHKELGWTYAPLTYNEIKQIWADALKHLAPPKWLARKYTDDYVLIADRPIKRMPINPNHQTKSPVEQSNEGGV